MTRDKIEIFGERIKRLNEGLQKMRDFGLDEEILIAWLYYKLKISQKDAKSILRCEEEFFTKLLKKDILKSFEDEN